MFTHDDFAAEAAEHFQFLESDYGMRREPLQKSNGRSWVAYGNVNVKVVIELEEGGYCSVTVQNLRHIKHDPLERSEFDLDEILAVSDPRQRRQELRAVRGSVARAAETLRTAGAPILSGDFEALHARQRKAVETLRAYNPPLHNDVAGDKGT